MTARGSSTGMPPRRRRLLREPRSAPFALSSRPPVPIIRHYATLYFIFCVDDSESELGILDLIQVFVESLDRCFENVCELDLVFHMDRVRICRS